MLGHLNMRTYIAIGVVVGVVVGFLSFVGGEQIAGFAQEVQNNAIGNGIAPMIANFVTGPIILVFTEPIIGGVLIGILWPLAIVWLVLLLLLIMLAAFGTGYNDLSSGTGVQ